MDKVTSDVLVAKTRLLRAREQSAATRLLSLRKVAQETPARQKIVVLTGAERPKKCRPLAPRPKISLQEKLAGIYADEPTPLPLKLESAALAEDASVEDIRSAEGSIEFWGEHSPLRQGASDFNSSSANGALDSPTPRGRGISASSADTSLGTKGSFRENRGGGMKKGRSDAAGSSQSSAIAPVAAPVMAPPPPARDPVVAKRRSLKGIRPVGSSVSAPPPLVSRAKPGAPPPLLSQASRAPAGASVKPPPPPPPSLSHGSNLYGGGDSRSLPPPPPPMAPNPHDAEGGMNPPPPPLPRPPPPAVSGSVPQFTPPPPPPPSKPASAPAPQPPLPPPRTSQSQVAPPPPPPPPPPLPPVPSSQPQPPSFQLLPPTGFQPPPPPLPRAAAQPPLPPPPPSASQGPSASDALPIILPHDMTCQILLLVRDNALDSLACFLCFRKLRFMLAGAGFKKAFAYEVIFF